MASDVCCPAGHKQQPGPCSEWKQCRSQRFRASRAHCSHKRERKPHVQHHRRAIRAKFEGPSRNDRISWFQQETKNIAWRACSGRPGTRWWGRFTAGELAFHLLCCESEHVLVNFLNLIPVSHMNPYEYIWSNWYTHMHTRLFRRTYVKKISLCCML